MEKWASQISALPHGGDRSCVFLHGAGSTLVLPPSAYDTEYYWGGQLWLRTATPFCTSYVFNHADTVGQGWDSDLL